MPTPGHRHRVQLAHLPALRGVPQQDPARAGEALHRYRQGTPRAADFPLDQVALKAAVIAHCAGPERRPQFIDVFFAQQASWARAKDPRAGAEAAGPAGRAERRPSRRLSRRQVARGRRAAGQAGGQQKFDISSTPTFIIGGKAYPRRPVHRADRDADRPVAWPVGFHIGGVAAKKGALPQYVALPPLEITRLRVSGFKSFSDPVELQFDPGLTGIVGPNGCGKSNIVEALRWAMGEGSAKGLRSDGMEDVIFNGSATARPMTSPRSASSCAGGRRALSASTRRASSRSRAGSAGHRVGVPPQRPRGARARHPVAVRRRGRGLAQPRYHRPGPDRLHRRFAARRPAPAARGGCRHRRPTGPPTRGRAAAGGDPTPTCSGSSTSWPPRRRAWPNSTKQSRQAQRYRQLAADLRDVEAHCLLARYSTAARQAAAGNEAVAEVGPLASASRWRLPSDVVRATSWPRPCRACATAACCSSGADDRAARAAGRSEGGVGREAAHIAAVERQCDEAAADLERRRAAAASSP